MAGKRSARLNEQFRREITGVLRTEVRDPRVGVPTVTGVEVTPDLWMARVYVRPDPSIAAASAGDELVEGLEAAAPFIRRELGKTLSLRRIPELRFELDRTIEHAARIHALLAEVRPDAASDDEGSDELSDDGEP
jgi:ribosome-binding factor A